jgi:uncharacterized protein (UPF0210 family)
MNIRSVTLFVEPEQDPAVMQAFLTSARSAFPVPVQSVRLATPPFPDWWPAGQNAEQGRNLAAEFVRRWSSVDIDYISLGPVQLAHDSGWLAMIPKLLGASAQLFAAVEIANVAGEIDPQRAQQAAALIRQVSRMQENGFGNLFLTITANCKAGSPFFPVAFHQGGRPHFALAVEGANLALQAIQKSKSLTAARKNLIAAIEAGAQSLSAPALALADRFDISFSGIDFSLAPFPTPQQSLAAAMEALGIPFVGASGALFAAGLITEAIERADFPRCGFSGLMLPVLEDAVLAERAAAGNLKLQDLVSYAAVCGVGLDTIPLPGAVTTAQLTAVLLDIAMLAVRLNKPLTARLMPLPGLKKGDPVQFDFPFFADSGVMEIYGEGISGILTGAAPLQIQTISSQSKGAACTGFPCKN